MKKQIKEKLLNHIIDNYNKSSEIKNFCDNVISSIQKDAINNPTVYLAKTKDIKTGNYYLVGKTYLPLSVSEIKEIKIYVGKLKDFPKGTKDESGMLIAKRKIREKIKSHLTTF
jgi:hypothetical protein